jgi:hypothetical protein
MHTRAPPSDLMVGSDQFAAAQTGEGTQFDRIGRGFGFKLCIIDSAFRRSASGGE